MNNFSKQKYFQIFWITLLTDVNLVDTRIYGNLELKVLKELD